MNNSIGEALWKCLNYPVSTEVINEKLINIKWDDLPKRIKTELEETAQLFAAVNKARIFPEILSNFRTALEIIKSGSNSESAAKQPPT